MKPVFFTHRAEGQLEEIRAWYHARSDWAELDFIERLDLCLLRLRMRPDLHRRIHADYRRVDLGRFPYFVYVRELDDRWQVAAILHRRRSPELHHGATPQPPP